jgi:cell wall-associated NlpC family hydrolase
MVEVRPPAPLLKTHAVDADLSHMRRGGVRLRRRFVPLSVAAVMGSAAVLGVPTSNASNAPRPVRAHVGEPGSGPAPFRAVYRTHRSARAASFRWSDVDGSDAWAKKAINHVGKANDWMRDFAAKPDGSVPFKPDTIETRKYLARAVVKAFAPGATVDPSITFTDLDPTQTFYKWANIAVQRGWMKRAADGRFMPEEVVTTRVLHTVLVHVLGMKRTARELDRLHTVDGVVFPTPPKFGALMLGMRLGLRYNNSNESLDVGPRTPLSRAQVAYSLHRAATLPSWVVPWVAEQYDGIVLPAMGGKRRAIVRWGIRYIGYPYVWGGEWGLEKSPASLGGQAVPGFDCSGLVWWALRQNDGGAWKVHPPRPYAGWPLAQRTSADMARTGSLPYKKLLPGDLMFYDGDGNGTVDHVDIYIGNGYALDSSNTPGGVTIMWVGSGWYRDHFVHGRRLLPSR